VTRRSSMAAMAHGLGWRSGIDAASSTIPIDLNGIMSESSIDPERAGRPRRQAQLRYAMGGAARGMHHANPVAPIKERLQLCGFVEKERQRRVPSCVRASLRTGNSSERRRVDVASGAGSSAARPSQSPRARRGQPRRVAMIRTVRPGATLRRCRLRKGDHSHTGHVAQDGQQQL
jgi:hypothetical protein